MQCNDMQSFLNGKNSNFLNFVSHMVSVTTIQPCHCSMKEGIYNM